MRLIACGACVLYTVYTLSCFDSILLSWKLISHLSVLLVYHFCDQYIAFIRQLFVSVELGIPGTNRVPNHSVTIVGRYIP